MKSSVRLFIPGPVEVREELLGELSQPMIGHRSPAFSDLYTEVITGLRAFLQTKNHIYLSTSSSTGLMEAAIRNCVKERCLNLACGAFSHRWHQIALACGRDAELLEVSWGSGFSPQLLDEALSKKHYEAVTLVHNETSTGVMNPLAPLAEVMAGYPEIFFLVDCVSSMGGVPIAIDEWGIDVALAGIQKAFGLPPGLSVAVVAPRVLEKSESLSDVGYYFSFPIFESYALRHQTPTTPAIPQLFALRRQLAEFAGEGRANRFQRHARMAARVQEWGLRHFDLFAEEGFRSDTVTCIRGTESLSIAELIAHVQESGYQIANGYGPLRNKTFRIAHMGDRRETELEDLLSQIEQSLETMS